MARRSAARSSPAPAPVHRPAPPAPTHAPTAPAPAPVSQSQPGLMSMVGSSIASGVGSGIGFSVANRLVDGIMGPRETVVRHEGAPAAAPVSAMPSAPSSSSTPDCRNAFSEYERCMRDFNDADACKPRLDYLKSLCQF